MARTKERQSTQVRKSEIFNDDLVPGVTLETDSNSLEGDNNSIRSQIKRALGTPNWYDDLATANGKKRSVAGLNADLDILEERKRLCRTNVLTDITVPGGANYVILSVAGSASPTSVAAASASTNGAVVAVAASSGGSFGQHELAVVAGSDAVSPKNLVLVIDAVTGFTLSSNNRNVFGLMQYESTGVNGASFNDISGGNRVKISFVRMNDAFDGIEACPVVDIAGRSVNYSYARRTSLLLAGEDCSFGSMPYAQASSGGGGGGPAFDVDNILTFRAGNGIVVVEASTGNVMVRR